jgi:hypothetical protein
MNSRTRPLHTHWSNWTKVGSWVNFLLKRLYTTDPAFVAGVQRFSFVRFPWCPARGMLASPVCLAQWRSNWPWDSAGVSPAVFETEHTVTWIRDRSVKFFWVHLNYTFRRRPSSVPSSMCGLVATVRNLLLCLNTMHIVNCHPLKTSTTVRFFIRVYVP